MKDSSSSSKPCLIAIPRSAWNRESGLWCLRTSSHPREASYVLVGSVYLATVSGQSRVNCICQLLGFDHFSSLSRLLVFSYTWDLCICSFSILFLTEMIQHCGCPAVQDDFLSLNVDLFLYERRFIQRHDSDVLLMIVHKLWKRFRIYRM